MCGVALCYTSVYGKTHKKNLYTSTMCVCVFIFSTLGNFTTMYIKAQCIRPERMNTTYDKEQQH